MKRAWTDPSPPLQTQEALWAQSLVFQTQLKMSEEPKTTCKFLFKKSNKTFSARKRNASDSDKGIYRIIFFHGFSVRHVWTGQFYVVRTFSQCSRSTRSCSSQCLKSACVCSSDRSSGEEGSAVVRKKKAAVANPMIQKVCRRFMCYVKSALFVFYEAVVYTEAITTSHLPHTPPYRQRKWRGKKSPQAKVKRRKKTRLSPSLTGRLGQRWVC